MTEVQNREKIPVIYICAPYRSPTEWGLVQNIRYAEMMAIDIWRVGAVALCPHKNTAHFGGADSLKDTIWLDGDIELLSRCDALFCSLSQDKITEGMRAEIEFCRAHEIPILEDAEDTIAFINAFLRSNQ